LHAGNVDRRVLTIYTQAVGLPARMAASECSAIYSVAIDAIGRADLDNLPEVEGETLQIHMEIKGRSDEQRLEALNRRLAAMCVSDLARGIRSSLEAAAAYIDFRQLEMVTLARGTEAEVWVAAKEKLSEFRVAAQALNHPQLVEKVQAGLASPLAWAPELASFQKVRNCLEHRGGIVGARDVDGSGLLRLNLPSLEIGLTREDGELDPLPFGERLEKERVVATRVRVQEHTFALGQPVGFPPSKIREVAFAVWIFADDLVEKLTPPSPPPS
jgi:hypothetical protein